MKDGSSSCARPASKAGSGKAEEPRATEPTPEREEPVMTARVGKQAPDFSAPAYLKGKFTNVSLSDFSGKWVLLCFYPGDFTFV